jgi:hypothetical protein
MCSYNYQAMNTTRGTVKFKFTKLIIGSLLITASMAISPEGVASTRSVVVWGEQSGDRPVPQNLTDVIQVTTGVRHCAALKNDGSVVTWGTFDQADQEVPQPENLTNVIAIASGKNHVIALCGDGTVVRWGNYHDDRPAMPAGLSNVVAIAGGFDHSMALKSDGTVVVWQTLDGVVVPPGLNKVVQIAATSTGGLALQEDGTLVGFEPSGITTNFTDRTGTKKIAAQISSTAYLRLDGTVALPPGADSQLLPLTNLFGVKDLDVGAVAVIALLSDGSLKGFRPSGNGGELSFPPSISNNVVNFSIYERSCIALVGDSVITQPPLIVTNPTNATNLLGATQLFSVTATGTAPLSYQWRWS